MKKLLTFLAMLFYVGTAGAQATEYLQQKEFQAEKKKIYEGINASRKQLNEIKKSDTRIVQTIDSVKQTLAVNASQMVVNSDSLNASNARVNALKEQVDSRKMISRGMLVTLFVITLILFIIVFYMLFLVRSKADAVKLMMADLETKTKARLDAEITSLNGEIKAMRDALAASANDLNHKISSALLSLEEKSLLSEQKMKEQISVIEVKVGSLEPLISKLNEVQSLAIKNLEDAFHALKRETDLIDQGFSLRATKLETDLKLLKGK